MQIEAIQDYLADQELDGWLLADFHGRNSIAVEVLELSGIVTRRSFFFIPRQGKPTALVHAIEQARFEHLDARIQVYSSYTRLEDLLVALLPTGTRVAMEYSHGNRLPYVSLVDAGTVELVRGLGVEVVSSADLVASFQARLSAEQIAAHRIAAHNLLEIKDRVFTRIAESLRQSESLSEYTIVQFILEQFEKYDMQTAHAPICAVDANAGSPHYEPSPDSAREIVRGSLILIDLWAKLQHRDGVYGDITWMAFAGAKSAMPERFSDIFSVLVEARDSAVTFIREKVDKSPVYGYQVDDVCRGIVATAGYADNFTHRTGHSITSEEHGPGPNIDNLETEDRRKLQKGHLFSIEPGIYFPDCGFRTEINVLISHDGVEVTTLPLQTTIIPLL